MFFLIILIFLSSKLTIFENFNISQAKFEQHISCFNKSYYYKFFIQINQQLYFILFLFIEIEQIIDL